MDPPPSPLSETAEADSAVGGAAPPAAPALPRGFAIGRYIVLETLGQGGMGIVVAAYDPQLDRRVAIKLLRHDRRRQLGAGVRDRVLREARALARVVHPNIVAVHDADFHDDELYVVMELCEGVTLRGWLAARPRTPAEVRALFLQAGRGLSAAHAAGIVHRDFKPDNVLVGADGRVRVADFGLARVLDAADPIRAPRHRPAEGTLTQTGAVIGTPAYMAPEQHEHAEVDARADQYAFCVALHEALYGVRPFVGASYAELRRNVRAGRRFEPPARREVPARLRAVVARGLAADPIDRFPSMDALLAALAVDPAATRRRWLRAGALAAAAAAIAAVPLLLLRPAAAPAALCRSGPAEVAAVWNPAVKAGMAAAFTATGRPYARDNVERVAGQLDAYAGAWAAMRDDACAATQVRGTQSPAALDLRMGCLDRRLRDLRAFVSVLSRDVDDAVLARAAALAADLEPVSACADLEALGAAVPPPAEPALRAQAEVLHAEIAVAATLQQSGKPRPGLVIAAAAVADARALGWKPTLAEALIVSAGLLTTVRDLPAAEASLREALQIAAEAHDDAAVSDAAIGLVDVVGHLGARLDEAAILAPFVEAALARSGADAVVRARWHRVEGNIAVLDDKLDDARADYEQAVALLERALGPTSPALAQPLADLGIVLRYQGTYPEALALCRRALAITEAGFGPTHPDVATTLSYLGTVLADLARWDEAEQALRRSLAIDEAAMGPDEPELFVTMAALGRVLAGRGSTVEARARLEHVLALRERTFGPRHTSVAATLAELGWLALRERKLDEAERDFARAEDIDRERLGATKWRTVQIALGLGAVALERRRWDQALRIFERAHGQLERAHGPDHRDVGHALAGEGAALEGQGRHAEAVPRLERAVAILEKVYGPEHPDLARPRALLAAARSRR